MYRRILVPLDGSALAEVALAQLPDLAGPDTEVLLLRVVEPPPAALPSIAFLPSSSGSAVTTGAPPVTWVSRDSDAVSEVAERLHQDAQKYLDEKVTMLRGYVAKQRTIVVEDVDPAAVIAGEAHDEGADLILMSTHGRSGAVRLVLGSVAEKVLHATGIPLLLVRPSRRLE
jgi:nucleotide-binding universal stress UspA family protein